MENKCENCWEFKECKKEDKDQCVVYEKDLGKECWFVSGLTATNKERNYSKCFSCDWFKKMNPMEE